MIGRISIVLPRRERFSPGQSGAVALTVDDYVRHSSYRDVTEVLGTAVDPTRAPDVFRAIVPRDRWWRRRNLGFAAGCAAHMETEPPRHIDVHNRIEVFHFLAERFPDAAVSLWLHNDPQSMRGARRPGQRTTTAIRAHRVICVSDWVRRRFIEGVTDATERVIVLPNAMPIPQHVPGRAVGMDKEPTILFVGRINADKGCLLFAEAVAQALPALPGWQAAMIGTGAPRMLAQVKKITAALGERLEMPGFIPHDKVMLALERAAIVVVPSLWNEPFGRAALEAMAAGCAVIATRQGGLPEVIGDSGIGLDAPTPSSLAACIIALARDTARRRDLQQRATARAAKFFAIEPWAARLDGLRMAAHNFGGQTASDIRL